MSHYTTSSLEEDESDAIEGHLHWMSVYRYICSALLMALITAGIAVTAYYSYI